MPAPGTEYQCARVLLQYGIQDRDWKKIEEAAELLNIPTYGAVSIARDGGGKDQKTDFLNLTHAQRVKITGV